MVCFHQLAISFTFSGLQQCFSKGPHAIIEALPYFSKGNPNRFENLTVTITIEWKWGNWKHMYLIRERLLIGNVQDWWKKRNDIIENVFKTDEIQGFHVRMPTQIERAFITLKLSSCDKMDVICFLLIYVAKWIVGCMYNNPRVVVCPFDFMKWFLGTYKIGYHGSKM